MYGVGYCMCVGLLFVNCEFYFVFIWLFNSFIVKKYDDVDCYFIMGNDDFMSLVVLLFRFKLYFVFWNDEVFLKVLEKVF